MGKKNMDGQLDMFELFGSVEELERSVKAVPVFPEEIETEEVKETAKEVPKVVKEARQEKSAEQSDSKTVEDEKKELHVQQPGEPVMEKAFTSSYDSKPAVIAYIDYNMVYVKEWKKAAVTYQFTDSKIAVDYYMKQMQLMMDDKNVKVLNERVPLEKAKVIHWTELSEI